MGGCTGRALVMLGVLLLAWLGLTALYEYEQQSAPSASVSAVAVIEKSSPTPLPTSTVTPTPQDTPRPGVLGMLIDSMITAQESARIAQQTQIVVDATSAEADRRGQQSIAMVTAEAEEYARRETSQASIRATDAMAEQIRSTSDETLRRSGTATQQAWTIISWTATADSNIATATAGYQATQDTLYLISNMGTATQDVKDQAYADRLKDLELSKRQSTNMVIAWGPIVLFGLATSAIIAYLIVNLVKLTHTPARLMPNKAGELGVMFDKHGNWMLPDKSPVAGGQLSKTGNQPAQLADPGATERAIGRGQAKDLATHAQIGAPRQSERQQFTPPVNQIPRFKIFGPDQMPGPLARDPEVMRILEGQWKEEA